MVTIGYDGSSGSSPGRLPATVGATDASAASGAEDAESRDWVRCLRAEGEGREDALTRLRAVLLRVARFEVERRRRTIAPRHGDELDDIASAAADGALLRALSRLDEFRGQSSFTTWASKFAVREAAARMRRRAWDGRELPLESEAWTRLSRRVERIEDEEQRVTLSLVRSGAESLTADERRVLAALALDDVPIDVLAARSHASRGALYRTLQDGRRKLRRHAAETGLTTPPATQAAAPAGPA